MRIALGAAGVVLALGLSLAVVQAAEENAEGWVSLFDGKTLDGWKVSTENSSAFVVKDGTIGAVSGRAHLFYNGPVGNHDFKNFEFQCDVMTTPGSNSGIYIHTEYQESNWPYKGYECQVNQTHEDWRKTGGLYGIQDNKEAVAKDGEWFHYEIKVEGKHIVTKINGKTVADFTEPEGWEPPQDMPGRKLSSGTIAFQAHDPNSKTYFKNIKIKLLD